MVDNKEKIDEKDYDEPLGRVNKFNKQMIIDWNIKNKDALINKLTTAIEILDKAGIKGWWMDCGSCLGTWRNQKFIAHDIDIDIAFTGEKEEIDRLHEVLKNFSKDHRCDDYRNEKRDAFTFVFLKMDRFPIYNPKAEGKEMGDTYLFAGNYFDIYCYKYNKSDNSLEHKFEYDDDIYGASFKFDYDLVFPLAKGTLEGVSVNVPGNTKRYLEHCYGYLGPDYAFCQKAKKYIKKPVVLNQ